MIKKPLVSIVVPTYNRDYILWRVIQSIQAQTYSNWELVIVDDRSTDATLKLMRQFRTDKRIKYMVNKYSHSPAGARRFGQENATGDLIGYIDSDNTALSQWLQEVVSLFTEDKNAVFVYPSLNFKIDYVDSSEKITTLISEIKYKNAPNIDMLWSHDFEGDPNGMVHRANIKDVVWDEKLSLYEDYDFSLQLAEKYPEGMRYLNKVLINYTRLYGEAGICNDASYESLVKNLSYLNKKHKNSLKWNNHDWYKSEIEKYTAFDKQGMRPIDRILTKYGKFN